ncbi:MAG: MATE family efflux transporter [Lachnospiraceae bacterium]|nr:MATE family efflux transporter [Lachnospiraceae bacterium]
MKYETIEKDNIIQKLFWYAVPLIIGNIVLLSYDLVDALVISKFVGEVGLGAVSNAGQISSLTLMFFYGLCMGASVIVSEYYGAKDMIGVKLEVSTVFIAGSIFAISVSLLIASFADELFSIMQVPLEIVPDAILYLRIACIGLPFVFVYNVFANALKAMGNSKVPTFFLALSAVINTILDLIFVVIFRWGVAGASIATVLAQITTCLITYTYVQLSVKELRLGLSDMVVKRRLLIRTFKDGIITAIQQAVPPLGKTLILAKVNTLGVAAVAANGIINRIDNFAILPAQNIGLGIMTYVAQCRGAKRDDLIYEIFKKGAVLEMGFAAIIFSILFFFKYDIMVALSPRGSYEVIALGNGYLHIMAFGYFLVGFVNTLQCFFRGMGNMSLTLYSSLINLVIKIWVVYQFIDILKFDSVAWGTIIGWVIMNSYGYTMYRYHKKYKWKDVYIAPTPEQVAAYKAKQQ